MSQTSPCFSVAQSKIFLSGTYTRSRKPWASEGWPVERRKWQTNKTNDALKFSGHFTWQVNKFPSLVTHVISISVQFLKVVGEISQDNARSSDSHKNYSLSKKEIRRHIYPKIKIFLAKAWNLNSNQIKNFSYTGWKQFQR